jgi:hypothetical protein
MDTLPHEIISIIVLMVAKLVTCGGMLRTVCKEWKDIIDMKYNKPYLSTVNFITTATTVEWARNNGCCIKWICRRVSRSGKLEVLQWVHDEGYNWDLLVVCRRAAEHGSLNILKWLHANGFTDYHKWLCLWAATFGHVPILEWAYDNYFGRTKDDLYLAACHHNQLAVLKWLHEKKHPVWDKALLMSRAKTYKYLHIIQWIDEECSES